MSGEVAQRGGGVGAVGTGVGCVRGCNMFCVRGGGVAVRTAVGAVPMRRFGAALEDGFAERACDVVAEAKGFMHDECAGGNPLGTV
jgi:hypothetical protein